MCRVIYGRSCLLRFPYSALKQLLWEGLTDKFYRYFKQNAQSLHFSDSLLVISCVQRAIRMEEGAARCSFCGAF